MHVCTSRGCSYMRDCEHSRHNATRQEGKVGSERCAAVHRKEETDRSGRDHLFSLDDAGHDNRFSASFPVSGIPVVVFGRMYP